MNSSVFFKLLNNSSRYLAVSRLSQAHKITTPFQCSRMSTNVSVSPTHDRDSFREVLPSVINSLTSNPKLAEVPEVCSWIRTILEYNLSGGKLARGLTTVYAYEMLAKPENVTEESLKLARVMGWCIEVLQAFFVVLDDMMDGSSTRRGMPCWHRQPGVGLGAMNDSVLIHSCIYQILKTYLGNAKQYVDVLELFHETILFTSSGQHLDFTMAHQTKGDYSLFTIERYNAIIKYKTAYYTYKLPVCLGMILANITDKEVLKRTEDICLELGKFFQMQDDFIDAFGDESITGKAGTDIQEGKCSWPAVTALQRCNSAQRALFEQCYGTKDPLDVAKIKQLYEQLELPRIYRELEKTHYDSIVSSAHSLSKDKNMSPKLFLKLVDMIYNRKR